MVGGFHARKSLFFFQFHHVFWTTPALAHGRRGRAAAVDYRDSCCRGGLRAAPLIAKLWRATKTKFKLTKGLDADRSLLNFGGSHRRRSGPPGGDR